MGHKHNHIACAVYDFPCVMNDRIHENCIMALICTYIVWFIRITMKFRKRMLTALHSAYHCRRLQIAFDILWMHGIELYNDCDGERLNLK